MVRDKLLSIFTLILLITLSSLGAAENPIIEMNLLPTLTYKANSDAWDTFFNGDLSLSLSSNREKDVRGEVVLKANTLTPITKLDDVLYKAYFKARFPSFRLTAGKNRLSWGDGMLFNAADVLYGSNDTSVSLTQAELRGSTDWLVSVNYPLGFFSFAEVVLMPPDSNKMSDTFFGARYYTLIKDVKIEGGYATVERLHKPYLSLQGNLGFDWYLSTSIALPTTGDSWVISAGVFHLVQLASERSLTLRLEFLNRPLGSWEAETISDSNVALLLYPELVFAYSPFLSFTLRSIISPLDLSAMSTFGINWNAFDAFNLIANISLATGEDEDLFFWRSAIGSPPSFSVTIGSSWIF